MAVSSIFTVIVLILLVFSTMPSEPLGLCMNVSIPQRKISHDVNGNTITLFEPVFTKVTDEVGIEGPIFDTEGNFYVVGWRTTSNSSRIGSLFNVDLETGENSAACIPFIDNSVGLPAGAQADRHGNIWIADLRLGLLKYTPREGCIQLSKVDTDGAPLQGMNDLVFDMEGNLWITAPEGPIAPSPHGIAGSAKKKRMGVLYVLLKGESVPRLIPRRKFRYPNGIAIKDDTVFVAEMVTRRIVAFTLTGPGQISKRRIWATIPKDSVFNWNGLDQGGPDGMDFDAGGRLLVAHSGSSRIEVLSESGELEARIKTPLPLVTNLHFKPNSSEVYVTEFQNGTVWKFDWECEGMPMYSDLREETGQSSN